MYLIQEIPGTEYQYDVVDAAVKQTSERWRILHSTTTKRFMIDTNTPTNKAWLSTPQAPYLQAGFPQGTAVYIAWMLNNLPG